MKKKGLLQRCLLAPFSLLYGAVVTTRNFLFDIGILPSETYPIPIICVGNISVGGTGKTPHVEYIIKLLQDDYRIAVLTRGYKRKSKGLVVATENSTVEEIGDEPLQIKLKYPKIQLVVDGNRRRAMDYLMSLKEDERPELVIMDDGFQHRYVKPSYSVLLIDINRPIVADYLLPLGNLRERASARYRANMIIVTKKPKTFQPIDLVLFERCLDLYKYQHLYFSGIEYQEPRPILSLRAKEPMRPTIELNKRSKVIAVSGIAVPTPFIEYLKETYSYVDSRCFSDHHNFSRKELTELNEYYHSLKMVVTDELYFICTEKDAVRLSALKDYIDEELLQHFYYLPITITLDNKEEEFKTLIRQAADASLPTLQ
ncbi:tetraacyldisaccharide 4'-kinase-like [Globicephala melas]|uniref:tetraacyldisaccharide 4'-kinase-like n=1 Tax=Globicephala melas TaxID=9731 RepID=UPI00293D52D9|nr:tetraacyldisaccharide 4'-kinase-like [Globicephala melas]